ncbi:MAG: hypothetical protein ACRDXE_04905 [Acidimicrobiales bacterium]
MSWAELVEDLSPVEERAGHWYKREDLFAPAGPRGVNGSKLRQLIHMAAPVAGTAPGILTACSVRSPQAPMAAEVARHFGMECHIVLGATHHQAAMRHTNVQIAADAGAEFIFAPVAYNPALQRSADALAARDEYDGWWRLPYAITCPATAPDAEVEAFHAVGARQVDNIPAEVTTIVMAAGSCNSATSVLYGLARTYPIHNVERVVLLEIGPTRRQWMADRLEALGRVYGADIAGHYGPSGPIRVEYHDLHGTGWARYGDRMPWTEHGIALHPTYEGKLLTYMNTHRRDFRWWWAADRTAMLWIVGAEPRRTPSHT